MPAATLVRDVMSADVSTLRPDDKVEHAADVLAAKGIGSLPVVDGDGKLVGILRDDDLIASEARVHVPTFINFLGLGMAFPGEMKHLEQELKKIAGATVAEVMQVDPPTVTADATLEDVASTHARPRREQPARGRRGQLGRRHRRARRHRPVHRPDHLIGTTDRHG